jgi:hypothetical protein
MEDKKTIKRTKKEDIEMAKKLASERKPLGPPKPRIVDAIKTPDGFSAVVSFPLPKNHWIFEEHGEPPAPLHTDSNETRMRLESIFRKVVKYAIQASTMSGKDMDFDPDAMIQNFLVGLFGYCPPNFPRDTVYVRKKLPNGKILEYVISKVKEE